MAKFVKATTAALPADIADLLEASDSKGVSFDTHDLIVPMISILQTGSPAVNATDAAFIDGASAGDFWLRGAEPPIRSGTAGIEMIFCGMQHCAVEFLPNRGGFVARHATMPADVVEAQRGTGRRPSLVRTNGNVVEDVRELYVLADGQPFMLPCKSTMHQFARELQSHFHQYQHPKTGKVLDSFARKYVVTTVPKSNGLGRWFKPIFTDTGWTSRDEYLAANELWEVVHHGKHRIDYQAE
jgi:hypothetical protein